MIKYRPLVVFFIVHLSFMWYAYPQDIIASTKVGHWEAIALGLVLEFVLFLFLLKGLSAFPGQSLTDLFNDGTGKWAARIVLFPFVCYLLLTLSLVVLMNSTMLTITFLRQTPLWVLIALLVIPLYAVLQGFEAISRASFVFFMLTAPVIVFSLASSFANSDIYNAMPLLDTKLSFVATPAFYSSLLAYSGFTVVGFLTGNDRAVFGKLRYIVPTFFILLVFYLLYAYIPLLIFGHKSAAALQYAMIGAMDTVEIEWIFFDRLSLFYIIAAQILVFAHASLLLWMMIQTTQKLYVPVSKSYLGIGFTAAAYLIAILIPNSKTMNELFKLDSLIGLYSMIAIPLIVFIMGRIKRRSRA